MHKIILFSVVCFGVLFSIIVQTPEASAHPGNTASDGKHYCRTNCASWGVPYGQRHGHGSYSSSYSSFSPSNYSYPSNESSYVTSNDDCPSHGFAYLGSCYQLPDNAHQSLYSGFDCDYGYEKVGYGTRARCLEEVEHGYYIGTTLYCDYGYEKHGGACYKERDSSSSYFNNLDLDSYTTTSNDPYAGYQYKYVYLFDREEDEIDRRKISSSCNIPDDNVAEKPYFRSNGECYYCEPGFITDTDKDSCYSMVSVCTTIYGENAEPQKDGVCGCSTGYELSQGTCVSISTSNSINDSKSTNTDLERQLNDLFKQINDLQNQLN